MIAVGMIAAFAAEMLIGIKRGSARRSDIGIEPLGGKTDIMAPIMSGMAQFQHMHGGGKSRPVIPTRTPQILVHPSDDRPAVRAHFVGTIDADSQRRSLSKHIWQNFSRLERDGL
jgi:hypothetical protein